MGEKGEKKKPRYTDNDNQLQNNSPQGAKEHFVWHFPVALVYRKYYNVACKH